MGQPGMGRTGPHECCLCGARVQIPYVFWSGSRPDEEGSTDLFFCADCLDPKSGFMRDLAGLSRLRKVGPAICNLASMAIVGRA